MRRLQKGAFSSSEERDGLLAVVLQARGLKAKDVVWMLFRPDRALRDAGTKLLRQVPGEELVEVFLAECSGKSEAALRAAAGVLLSLGGADVPKQLGELLSSGDEKSRDMARQLVLGAPPTSRLEPLLWQLSTAPATRDRLLALDRLAALEPGPGSLKRWRALARDDERQVRERALVWLAGKAPREAVSELVSQLPECSQATREVLTGALRSLAAAEGTAFADTILPLMASGDASMRSAVLKILLGMENRAEVVRRYIAFSKGLAGWARDRALESMREFGQDLVEPVVELLEDPDLEVRASALVVAGSLADPRVVPGVVKLLKDEDWWVRITAADTLGRFQDPRVVPALVEALGDSELRWAAVEALGRIGDPKALPALAELLKDPSAEVRIEVLLAMRRFRHPKILDVLQRVAASDADRSVRGRALEIAEEVARRDHGTIADADRLRATALKARAGEGEPMLHAMLIGTRNQGASDLHVAVGQPPLIRLAADLVAAQGEPFTAQQTQHLLREILTDEQWKRLEKERQIDLCYYIPKAGRYRANVFVDRSGLNAVFRVIPEQPPTIAEIGLPGHLAEIIDYHQGLVLVCGPSGSGKSTTLAALINLFNENKYLHVISLEDPVEFVHPFKNCLVNQREVGTHTRSYARALRAALREDPDVIVIGELRDTESVSLALVAAETGHIVLATLDSASAHKSVDRLISSFASDEQPQTRAALAESLRFVIAQRLLPSVERRRLVACFEVLKGTLSVANLIREDKTYQLPSAMQMAREAGMQSFDDALRLLLRHNRITPETAYLAAANKKEFEDVVSEEFLDSQLLV